MNTIRIRGEVPFPVAGEGVILRFTNPDCDKLQAKYGDEWFGDAWVKCNRIDMEFLRNCVAIGAKKDGKPFAVSFDELDATLHDISAAVLDALFFAVHGRNFEDHLEYMEKDKNLEPDQGNA